MPASLALAKPLIIGGTQLLGGLMQQAAQRKQREAEAKQQALLAEGQAAQTAGQGQQAALGQLMSAYRGIV